MTFPDRIKDHFMLQHFTERLRGDKIDMELLYMDARGVELRAKVSVPVDKYPTARESVMANLLIMVEAKAPVLKPSDCAPCPGTPAPITRRTHMGKPIE